MTEARKNVAPKPKELPAPPAAAKVVRARKGKKRVKAPAHPPAASAPAPGPPRELVTRAAAALALGVAPNRINKWVADGAPVAVPGRRGHSAMYDLDALQEWREAKQPGQDAGLSLGAARARLAEAQAVKWERENLLRAGQLVERTAAVAEGQAVLAALKARLLSLPRQAVMRGVIPREAEPALRGLVVEALRELARWTAASEPPVEAAAS